MATVGYGQNLAMNQEPTNFQHRKVSEISKRTQNYNRLKALGYEDEEIFEDLGNANFLSKKYENALYWYGRLMELSENGVLKKSYQKRYDHAVTQLGKQVQNEIVDENWTELVKDDYKMTGNEVPSGLTLNRSNFLPFQNTSLDAELTTLSKTPATKFKEYSAPVALTNGGKTAYFSKTIYRKPVTGLFSKKQKIHKIFKANKIEGEWRQITEVAICPADYSAKHPAVSNDGGRLFFASNMPGSFGGFDIYVADIHNNGTLGVAKNLGENVNSAENDVYPKPLANGTLVFASEGHDGYGGLDVFMAEVGQKDVGLAVNMGNAINSKFDDYSVNFLNSNGAGFVVSNRNSAKGSGQFVAFNLNDKPISEKHRDNRFLEAFNTGNQMQYSSSLFDDE